MTTTIDAGSKAGMHAMSVQWVPNNHGYPYRAVCSCGWFSNTYTAEHAAQTMADAHLEPLAATAAPKGVSIFGQVNGVTVAPSVDLDDASESARELAACGCEGRSVTCAHWGW
jgi:hypothetical protein